MDRKYPLSIWHKKSGFLIETAFFMPFYSSKKDERLSLRKRVGNFVKNKSILNIKLNRMEKAQIPAESTIPSLLSGFSEMSLKEVEYFIKELNALAIRKRAADKGKRDKVLLRKINETVLPEPIMERYLYLQEKMEVENLSDTEYQELLSLVDKEEKMRNKRFQYLLELSQLRAIPLTELMDNLGLNILNYA